MAFDAELNTNKLKSLDFGEYLTINPELEFTQRERSRNYYARFEPRLDDLLMLKRARDRIKHGWTKKEMYSSVNNGVCAIGALTCAVQGQMIPQPASMSDEAHIERLASLVEYSASRLMSLNDAYETTKAQMLALFDRAIARVEREQAVPQHRTVYARSLDSAAYLSLNSAAYL